MVYKIGCLGAARIADKALCFPAKVISNISLHAVAARDQSRAQRFAALHGFQHVHASYADLIADDAIDLIYNPLPIHLHAEWTIRALEAGKHVLCEKPFAMNVQEAARVQDSARQNNRRVIEAFHYRYHPAFEVALEWVRSGQIGPLRRLQASFTVPIEDRNGEEIRHQPETGGGAFMDLGTYPLHWVRQIVGTEPEITSATASCTARGVDETLTATLDFAQDIRAELHASMALAGSAHAA